MHWTTSIARNSHVWCLAARGYLILMTKGRRSFQLRMRLTECNCTIVAATGLIQYQVSDCSLWERLIEVAKSGQIERFMTENKAALSVKD